MDKTGEDKKDQDLEAARDGKSKIQESHLRIFCRLARPFSLASCAVGCEPNLSRGKKGAEEERREV